MVKQLSFFGLMLALLLPACGDDEETETLKAEAGESFGVSVGTAPTFDGCASTGDIENYQWTIRDTPENKAEDRGKVIREIESNCRFTLEDTMVIEEVGDWVVELEVRDGSGKTATDTVTVTVTE